MYVHIYVDETQHEYKQTNRKLQNFKTEGKKFQFIFNRV